MSADKPTRASDRVRPDVVQALLDDPLDYSSYTIAECRVLQAELRRLSASEAELIEALTIAEQIIGHPEDALSQHLADVLARASRVLAVFNNK